FGDSISRYWHAAACLAKRGIVPSGVRSLLMYPACLSCDVLVKHPAMMYAEEFRVSGGAEVLASHPALDVALEKGAGESVQLSEFWKDSPLIAVFMRHLG
ncbi:MAG: hypothetical protein V3U53_03850, partial [bacterium]